MKLQISSISDVVTNSSSEVYIMNQEDALEYEEKFDNYSDLGCVHIERIFWGNVLTRNYGYSMDPVDFVCGILKVQRPNLGGFNTHPLTYERRWLDWCEKHKKQIEDKVIGKWIVVIEHHGKESWTLQASQKGLWSKAYD